VSGPGDSTPMRRPMSRARGRSFFCGIIAAAVRLNRMIRTVAFNLASKITADFSQPIIYHFAADISSPRLSPARAFCFDNRESRTVMLQFSLDNGIESALINEGLVTKDQLTYARRIQEQLSGQKSLSDVLLEMNWVSETRLDDFIRRHRSSLSIGDILMARKLVAQQDV